MRIHVFDYLRALSAFMVLWLHTILLTEASRPFIGPIAQYLKPLPFEIASKLTLIQVVDIGQIAVAIFFLLSGFLVVRSNQKKTSYEFIVGVLLRIFPTTLTTVVISYLLLCMVNNLFLNVPFSFKSLDGLALLVNGLLLYDIWFVPFSSSVFETNIVIPTDWFLFVIIKFYLLCLFLRKVSYEKLLILSSSLTIFSLVFVIFQSSLCQTTSVVCGALANSFLYVNFILIGSCCYLLYEDHAHSNLGFRSYKQTFTLLFLVLMFLITFLSLRTVGSLPVPANLLRNYSIATGIFIIALLCSHTCNKVPSWITFLSNISFSLYVLHYPICGALLSVLKYHKIDVLLGNAATYTMVFFITIAASWLLYKLVEQPTTKLKYSLTLRTSKV